MNRFALFLAVVVVCVGCGARAAMGIGQTQYVEQADSAGSFPIVRGSDVAGIYVSTDDYPGVARAAGDLQADIARVSGRQAKLVHGEKELPADAIIIGTIGKSALIDRLAKEGKIDTRQIEGKWESFFLQVVPQPMPGVASALLIVGSDKRGTIYGIYDLSEEMGVSPWYYFADVPTRHADALFVKAGKYAQGEPAVKYRGIFLNDEAPDLSGWTKEKFGGYNHEFYTKVFELILRLKGNYLWPAMWGNAFNEDDPENPRLADEYGIVMGTSHHEPMMRAQQEWKRHGQGPWNYATNADFLRSFWDAGVTRNKNFESIITIGMRGDGDMPMAANGDMAANVALLEKIVADQRQIIAQRVNPDVTKVPQLWALYKEVQDYYEKGMRVPDDVTLLWCDDNWGNIRRLPTPAERDRGGGAGIYYHFDYVGGPRSYKWLNTNPIVKVWEQMNLAHEYGANRIWIVNVGHLGHVQFPIEFFLQMAWDPDRWPKEKIGEFGRLWAQREFGPEHAAQIADVIAKYTKFNGWRKPELIDPATFSLTNYHEADGVVADWEGIAQSARELANQLQEDQQAAFFELVLDPTLACAQVTELYVAAGKNRLYASQGRASTNDLAAQVRSLFKADQDLSDYYNHSLLKGKWDHMMDQTHIGFTAWNDPRQNRMPAVKEIDVPDAAAMGVALEGSTSSWPSLSPGPAAVAALPTIDVFNQQRRQVEVFNRGKTAFEFSATTSDPWIVLSAPGGKVDKQQDIWVSADWSKVPKGYTDGSVKITPSGGAGEPVTVKLTAFNPQEPARDALSGFVEANGYVSIEAEHYTRKIDTSAVRWEKIDDYGRTLSAMSLFPVTAASILPPAEAPCLEYRMYLFDAGKAKVDAYFAPTLNFAPGRGLRFAMAFDDQSPQVVDILADNSQRAWEQSVRDNIRIAGSPLTLDKGGYHTLKIWMVDPGVVLEKVVVDMGGMRPSYFGAPESYRRDQ